MTLFQKTSQKCFQHLNQIKASRLEGHQKSPSNSQQLPLQALFTSWFQTLDFMKKESKEGQNESFFSHQRKVSPLSKKPPRCGKLISKQKTETYLTIWKLQPSPFLRRSLTEFYLINMDSTVRDDNPYSRLMALSKMGVVPNFDEIR